MGVIKQSIVVCMVLVIATRLSRLFETPLPVNFGGTWDPEFKKVADVFKRNVESGKERGAAFAVYYKGKPVVDVWGGYTDLESHTPWKQDTTTLVFSCSKGVAAIIMAKMAEMGTLDYSKPVSYYWPEFAQADKDNITVEMLISHQGGLVYLDEQLSIYDYKNNRQRWQDILAKQKTAWPAGEKFGYHALTFGLFVDELIQRVDPAHRDTDTIFMEEISKPLDIDFRMKVPLEDWYRTARLVPRSKFQLLFDAFQYRRYLKPIYDIVFHPDSLMARSVSPVIEFAQRTDVLNNPYIREVTVSSLTGTGTARGLAKMYGIIANGGAHDGNQLLSKQSINRLSKPIVRGSDAVMNTGEVSEIGLGTLYRKNPWGEETVGHTGHGGQVAVGDIKNNIGISYLTNHLTIHGVGDDPRYQDLEKILYETIAELEKK
ncbi:beta-lactamase domain-containing protein 2-like [Ruditapes philippinarum]|uniref:beta-lactamase domain-containing protein 2-like n=1 Tax=Ruditapes philippinarum TaxID=129788 RepID=UPI00295A9943|nr:beta-lactamase domain-containing protein 2-like [Ruditapes philippinarum]